jgi:hypothetical protein
VRRGDEPLSFFRILIIANKWFEADPLMGVLSNPAARPPSITDLGTVVWPRVPQQSLADVIVRPRYTFLYGQERRSLIEIWCIQDLMNPFLSFSNTAEKARVLPTIFGYGKEPDFVIAFGTAGFPDAERSYNGEVVSGSRVFIHNPYQDEPNPASNWHDPSKMDRIIESAAGAKFLVQLGISSRFLDTVAAEMIPAPNVPAMTLELLERPEYTAVSEVNIVDPNDYGKFDAQSVSLARAAGGDPVGSVETTHGVIRVQSEAPFIFLSGITDRLGHFNDDVTIKRPYKQNFVAAHNAGIVGAWLIPEICAFCSAGKPVVLPSKLDSQGLRV